MTVPFEIPDINHGFKKASGLIKLLDGGFSLEFEVEDGFIGIFKSGVKNIKIDYADLESIAFNKGWLNDKIILEGISMQAFEKIPGTEVATCTLKTKRKHREEAQKLISQARLQLSEFRLNQMEGD